MHSRGHPVLPGDIWLVRNKSEQYRACVLSIEGDRARIVAIVDRRTTATPTLALSSHLIRPDGRCRPNT